MAHKQKSFFKTNWAHRDSYGGELRKRRLGRGARPITTKMSMHVVFKIKRDSLPAGLRSHKVFALVHEMKAKYSKRFLVGIEQISIQQDHIHILCRCGRRELYQSFFRVFAGQVAQVLAKLGLSLGKLWLHRPFSRVVRGRKGHQTVRDYIQLNEREARGEILYRKDRLRGLSEAEIAWLWE